MNWRLYALLFGLGLVVSFGVSSFQHSPGYLDSDYYFAGGIQLVEGKGFTEPFLWNYLGDPVGLPHPSHTYWFPLSSILAAISMVVTGTHDFYSARLIFIFIAALVPPVTAHLAMKMTGRFDLSLSSGLLAVFSVYYLPFMPVTDNYGPVMLLGGWIFILLKKESWWGYLVMGTLAGLMNLARSDGLLWLALLGLMTFWKAQAIIRDLPSKPTLFRHVSLYFSQLFRTFGLIFFGYLIIMFPWYMRNISLFGSPMAPGGSRILWLTNYNDTFAFPSNQVNLASWLAAGWNSALQVRLWAFRMNIMNAFAAQGSILLFPFIMIGFWHFRHDIRTKLAGIGWLILFGVMTIFFPLAGARGGFFHAGAAFQPFWWSLAPLGLSVLTDFLYKRNILSAKHAGAVFQSMLVLICVLLSGLILQLRVLQPGWQPEEDLYLKVEQYIVEKGAGSEEVVIVRNPALYFLVSRRSAIVIPPGGPDTILAVAARYDASYFVLEPGGVLEEYQAIYNLDEIHPGLEYLGEVNDARIYAIHITE